MYLPAHIRVSRASKMYLLLSRASLVAQLVRNLPSCRRRGFYPWVGKTPCRKAWQPTPVFLPGESHGQRSLEGYNPWGRKESDMTERLSTHSLIDSPKSVNNFLLPPQQMTMSLVVLNNTNVSYLRFWKSDIQNQCH